MVEVPVLATQRHGGRSTTNYGSALRMYRGALRCASARSDEPRRAERERALGASTTPRGATRPRSSRGWEDAGARRPAAAAQPRARRVLGAARPSSTSTLLVTREYEHLLVALTRRRRPARASATCALPHPSGLAVDRDARRRARRQHAQPEPGVSTSPRSTARCRARTPAAPARRAPARPACARASCPARSTCTTSRWSAGELHAQRGRPERGRAAPTATAATERVWWPRGDRARAAARTSTATTSSSTRSPPGATSRARSSPPRPTRSRRAGPGHRNFPVDRRGVIFSGATREPIARGLTRPHSARLHGGRLWVDNSGYGELGRASTASASSVARLPGWTRGLALRGRRRVRRHVARDPALPPVRARPRRRAQRLRRPRRRHPQRASARQLRLADGNQIFAVEAVPRAFTLGFPFRAGRRARAERDRGASSTHFDATRRPTHEHDFRLLMIGAMYENGGNTTHRFLDGHPQLFVYPFESQVGTRLVQDQLTSMFPVKYRWPEFPLDATPEQDYHAIIDEEGKVRARTPHVSKFRDEPFDISRRRAARASTARTSSETGRSRAEQHGRVLPRDVRGLEGLRRSRATRRSTSATARSSSSTPSRILDDLPERPLPARRAQPVVGVRRHEEAAGAAVARATTCSRWTLNQQYALLLRGALSRTACTSCAPRT